MPRAKDLEDANKDDNKYTEKGMVWERSCTDIFCCLIFIAFLVSMIGITGYAVAEGDPMDIITPFDSVGNRCGKPNQGIP